MVFKKAVHGRQKLEAKRFGFARGIQDFQQRGQHSDRRDECDDHAGAGNLSEFRHALVVGWQEREEARSRRDRSKRQRHCGILGRLLQSGIETVEFVTFGTIPHAVLDAEIHTEADKQDKERDRNQIERTDQHETDSCGDGKSDHKRDENRANNLGRFERTPQDEEHDQDRTEMGDQRAFLHCRELVIRDRHRSGQTDPCAEILGEVGIRSRLADRLGRRAAGFQRIEVENRPHQEQDPLVTIRQRFVARKFPP